MADVRQMVGGFNHNVKHRGKAYHVQTEDSGVQNPHITTHLFVGGNILASKKTSYADVLQAENLTQVVRELMEEQHKEMLRNLVNGVYDDRDEALSSKARSYQPGQLAVAPSARPPSPPATLIIAKPPPAMPPPRPAEPARVASPPIAVAPKPQSPPQVMAPPSQVVFRPALTPPPVLSRPAPAASGPARPPVAQPPANGLGVPVLAPVARAAPPIPSAPAPARGTAPSERLAAEKSLDQVILSYLAEEEPRTRK